MTLQSDGVGLEVSGLTPGQSYRGTIQFWAEGTAPDVAAAIDNQTFGATSSAKRQDSQVAVNFTATDTNHFLSLNPMSQSANGYVWVKGFYFVESQFAGNLFTGASGSSSVPGAESGTITLAGIMVQILRAGKIPARGGFISGQGNAGCEFEALPTQTPYNEKLDRVGMSAKLVETAPWL